MAILFNLTLFIDYLFCLGLHKALLGMFNSARQIYAFCPEGIYYVQENYFGRRFLVRFLHRQSAIAHKRKQPLTSLNDSSFHSETFLPKPSLLASNPAISTYYNFHVIFLKEALPFSGNWVNVSRFTFSKHSLLTVISCVCLIFVLPPRVYVIRRQEKPFSFTPLSPVSSECLTQW